MAEAVKSITASTYSVTTGPGIRYIGEHAYALSGFFAASTNEQTALSFTSGTGYIYGYIQLNGAVDDDSPAFATLTSLRITFNGQNIFILTAGIGDHLSERSVRQKIIIPPLTEVIGILDHAATATDNFSSVVLTGRVYGAE